MHEPMVLGINRLVAKNYYVNKNIHRFKNKRLLINLWILWITTSQEAFRQ